MKTVYIIHCTHCNRLCLKENEHDKCPPEPENKELSRGVPTVMRWQPYYDKFQCREFKTRKQFEEYCKRNNLDRPEQAKINAHREQYQTHGPKAYRKGVIYG